MTEPDVESKYSTFNLYAVSIYIGNITVQLQLKGFINELDFYLFIYINQFGRDPLHN